MRTWACRAPELLEYLRVLRLHRLVGDRPLVAHRVSFRTGARLRVARSNGTAAQGRHALSRRVGGTFVEDHHNVGTQRALDLHRLLGPHEHPVTVDRRAEMHPLLGDLAHLAEGIDLEAT